MAGGAVVSSLSWLHTHLLGSLFKDKYTLGQIIVDIIFAVAIAVLFFLTRRPKELFDVNPRSARGLVIGIVTLLLWYFLTVVDLFIHEARISVVYNYFFIDVAITALKFCAEGSLMATAYRIVVLHLLQQSRRAKVALIFGEFLILSLVVTALYSLGSLVARQIVWLQLADETTRNAFSWPQRRFEAAFYGVQFCMGFFTAAFATTNSLMIHRATGNVPPVVQRLFWAALTVWIWSTSEMAFVVKYHLGNRAPAKNTNLARDTIFSFFVLIFLIFLTIDAAGHGSGDNGDGGAAQAAAGGVAALPSHLHPLTEEMRSTYRTHIVDQLRARTHDNEKPPPLADLIADLRRHPMTGVAFSRSIRNERARLPPQDLRMVDNACAAYLAELEANHGALEVRVVSREV